MSQADTELLIYYGLVVLILAATVWQVRNLYRAYGRLASSQRAPTDLRRVIVNDTDVVNEWLRLASLAALLLLTGWLVALRNHWWSTDPRVTFGIFIGGLAVIPCSSLWQSWNAEQRDQRLRPLATLKRDEAKEQPAAAADKG